MAELDYPIYDTAFLADSAGVNHVLFQQGQGTGTNKTPQFTNMRGSGQFPDKESFELKGIGLHIDSTGFSKEDVADLFHGCYVTVTYNNVKIMQAPAYLFSDRNAYNGVVELASAAAFQAFGQEGKAYMLTKPVMVKGGKNFTLEFYQALAVDTANLDLKVVLYGTLISPDITVN